MDPLWAEQYQQSTFINNVQHQADFANNLEDTETNSESSLELSHLSKEKCFW